MLFASFMVTLKGLKLSLVYWCERTLCRALCDVTLVCHGDLVGWSLYVNVCLCTTGCENAGDSLSAGWC